MVTYIYILKDENNTPRYVGKSNNVKNRFTKHIYEASKYADRNTHKVNWIRSMLNNGLKPTIEIIDEVSVENWEYWEKFYIEQYKTMGFDITNSREGGGSHIGTKTKEEIKLVLKWKMIGKKHSKEQNENQSKKMIGNNYALGNKMSSKTKLKIIDSRKGKLDKKIICINTGIKYSSITEASKSLNIDHSYISRVCTGSRKSTNGLKFKFI